MTYTRYHKRLGITFRIHYNFNLSISPMHQIEELFPHFSQIISAAESIISKKSSFIFSGAGKSTLMSALALRNPGTFVGLNELFVTETVISFLQLA